MRKYYPKIYQKVYWGNFTLCPKDADEIKLCLEGRNSFIRDYGIKSVKKQTQKIMEFIYSQKRDLPLDHTEIYATHNKKVIIVTSPYNGKDVSGFEENGWTEIYPLYSPNARTFIYQMQR